MAQQMELKRINHHRTLLQIKQALIIQLLLQILLAIKHKIVLVTQQDQVSIPLR